MNRKIIVQAAAFLAVLGILFYHCYHILGYHDDVHSSAVFQQFYDLDEDLADVIWLGPSATQEFIIPTVMYDETGLALYSLSVGNEPFMASESLIRECERVQDPQLYLVDIRHLAYMVMDDTYIRRVTDNMEWSVNRFHAVKYMLGNLERYHPGTADALTDYIFSFTKYHTRLSGEGITKEDFGSDENVFFGYFIKTMSQEFDKEEIKSRFDAKPAPIPEESEQYLNDFLAFCDTFDKPVIFTKTPNCLDENLFGQYNYIQKIVEARGYEVWDLNKEADEIGLDYTLDFADPMHANVYGAQKISRYAAHKLMERYQFQDHRNDERYMAYRTMSSHFREKLMEEELKNTTDISEYLDRLDALDKNEYSVFIAVKDIQGYCLTQNMADKLKKLGFDQADILLEQRYHSFVGVIANGEVRCQLIGTDEEAGHYEELINGQKVSVHSETLMGKNMSSIKLGNKEYSKNMRGLNFVVVDHKDRQILDAVSFDTYVADLTCTR